MSAEFPVDGVELTTLLVVEDVERARSFYTDVLGAELFREYGGTSAVLRFQGAWILLVTGGRAHSRQTHRDVRSTERSAPSEPPIDATGARLSCRLRHPLSQGCHVFGPAG